MKRQQHNFHLLEMFCMLAFHHFSSQEEDCKKSQHNLSDGYAIALLYCNATALQRMPYNVELPKPKKAWEWHILYCMHSLIIKRKIILKQT